MLKSLLVAIDDTDAGRSAQDLAIDLARRLNASIEGLAVLDKPWIEEPRATPIGGGYYHRHRAETLRQALGEKMHVSVQAFGDRCSQDGITFGLTEKSGAPFNMIEIEAQGHDLILLGKATTFHFAGDSGPSDTVLRVIRDDPRPVIVTPPDATVGDSILVAYDGSLAAGRALHMFILLGLGIGRDITLLCVEKDEVAARQMVQGASALLGKHDVRARIVFEAPKGHPGKSILDHCRGKSMVVMGAFGRNHLRDFFFGSTTKMLIERSPASLFIHH